MGTSKDLTDKRRRIEAGDSYVPPYSILHRISLPRQPVHRFRIVWKRHTMEV